MIYRLSYTIWSINELNLSLQPTDSVGFLQMNPTIISLLPFNFDSTHRDSTSYFSIVIAVPNLNIESDTQLYRQFSRSRSSESGQEEKKKKNQEVGLFSQL